jgi:hypothetical protein
MKNKIIELLESLKFNGMAMALDPFPLKNSRTLTKIKL